MNFHLNKLWDSRWQLCWPRIQQTVTYVHLCWFYSLMRSGKQSMLPYNELLCFYKTCKAYCTRCLHPIAAESSRLSFLADRTPILIEALLMIVRLIRVMECLETVYFFVS